MEKTLKFSPDGSFRILLFTDLHAHFERKPYGEICRSMLRSLLRDEMPDLCIMTGDFVGGENMAAVMKIPEELGIPTAVTFGNHEPAGAARRELLELARSFSCCVNPAPSLPDGRCSTFFLPIRGAASGKTACGLWFCDTAPDTEADGGEYISPAQIAWFRKQHRALSDANGGIPLPSVWFQHIIFPEIYDALVEVPAGTPRAMPCFWDKKRFFIPDAKTLRAGTLNEMPSTLKKNTGMFDALAEAGGIRACFSGHDHDNDFIIAHRGLDFVNSPKACYVGSYNAKHGARRIVLREDSPDTYETAVVTFSSVYTLRHYLQNRDILCGGIPAVLLVQGNLLYRKAEDTLTAWIPEWYRKRKGVVPIAEGERAWAVDR